MLAFFLSYLLQFSIHMINGTGSFLAALINMEDWSKISHKVFYHIWLKNKCELFETGNFSHTTVCDIGYIQLLDTYSKNNFLTISTLGLLASNMPVERPMRRASWCLERWGETDRDREAREEEDSSMDDWAERIDSAAARRWAGEHNFINRGSSFWAKPRSERRPDLIKIVITLEVSKYINK